MGSVSYRLRTVEQVNNLDGSARSAFDAVIALALGAFIQTNSNLVAFE
ncbi:hypothetical protein ACWGJB_44635 [Streptomyces sp. NPDC054813]